MPLRLAAALIIAAGPAFAQTATEEAPQAAPEPKLEDTKREAAKRDEGVSLFGFQFSRGLVFQGRRSHAELRSSDVLDGGHHFDSRFSGSRFGR